MLGTLLVCVGSFGCCLRAPLRREYSVLPTTESVLSVPPSTKLLVPREKENKLVRSVTGPPPPPPGQATLYRWGSRTHVRTNRSCKGDRGTRSRPKHRGRGRQ